MEVAREGLSLAERAHAKTYRDPRIARREAHIGYYLVGEGRPILSRRVGCKHDFFQNLRAWLRRHPDEFFLSGIALLTFAIITGILLWLMPPSSSLVLVLLSMIFMFVHSSHDCE